MNMERMQLWGAVVEVDREATMAWYSQGLEWNCDCGHCRNFIALARRRQLPSPVLETLDDLGIRPEQATYVCQLEKNADVHLYQFSYRVAGWIQVEAENPAALDGRCCHDPYPYGAPNFPEANFDVEFFLWLPWVLPEEA